MGWRPGKSAAAFKTATVDGPVLRSSRRTGLMALAISSTPHSPQPVRPSIERRTNRVSSSPPSATAISTAMPFSTGMTRTPLISSLDLTRRSASENPTAKSRKSAGVAIMTVNGSELNCKATGTSSGTCQTISRTPGSAERTSPAAGCEHKFPPVGETGSPFGIKFMPCASSSALPYSAGSIFFMPMRLFSTSRVSHSSCHSDGWLETVT